MLGGALAAFRCRLAVVARTRPPLAGGQGFQPRKVRPKRLGGLLYLQEFLDITKSLALACGFNRRTAFTGAFIILLTCFTVFLGLCFSL